MHGAGICWAGFWTQKPYLIVLCLGRSILLLPAVNVLLLVLRPKQDPGSGIRLSLPAERAWPRCMHDAEIPCMMGDQGALQILGAVSAIR